MGACTCRQGQTAAVWITCGDICGRPQNRISAGKPGGKPGGEPLVRAYFRLYLVTVVAGPRSLCPEAYPRLSRAPAIPDSPVFSTRMTVG